ncbi:MAG: hypothetical protein EA345_02720 [Halomonas sp.]|nr:hypothetical protein [Halomonas sp.]TVP51386.1 MAG: hypothetical protein EA345_02720 [Halomonas sp.]
MHSRQHIQRQRLKLVMIFAVFTLPMVAAWGMVQWGVGIPDRHTAHGEVGVQLPSLHEWPLTVNADNGDDTWTLAFDCSLQCEQRMDEFWRLHRALGREAPRLTRLRIGGESEALPGEVASQWREEPTWQKANNAWLLDPLGRPALSFDANVPTTDVLDDIRHLFKVNPL